MKLRAFSRLAAAAATTALVVGGFAAPAQAAGPVPAELIFEEPVQAGDVESQGCEGIDNGKAVPDRDGWFFGMPSGDSAGLEYAFVFAPPSAESLDDLVYIVLTRSGVYGLDLTGEEPVTPTEDPVEKLSKSSAKDASAKVKALAEDGLLPTVPAPAGVTGAITQTNAWLKTPAGWLLLGGLAYTDSNPTSDEFELIRACPAAQAPSASPSPSAGPQLPVTGTNVWVLSGAGVALVVVGAVLFMAYRRRQSVKFVA